MKKFYLQLCLLSIAPFSFSQNRLADSLALVDLYSSTNGANWTNHDNWLQPGFTIDSWYGVVVSGNRVTNLHLSQNHVVGTLPSSIGNLNALTSLQIRGDQVEGLSGPIPSSIGNLTQLTYFDLARNFLSGPIPASFANLTQLQNLMLDANPFGGPFPTPILSLTSLTNLSLSVCNFSGSLPVQIENLTNLVTLNLIANQFTGSLPGSLANLTNLQQLYLNSNQFNGAIPPGLGSLNLNTAWFDSNRFSGTVPVFSGATGTLSLRLNNNELDSLPNLTSGTYSTLSLENNNFTFEDLEPNAYISNVTYVPQKKTPVPFPNPSIPIGYPYTLYASIGGFANQYIWFKNSVPIPGSTLASHFFTNLVSADQGTYFVQAWSPMVPGLTIESNPITLTVIPPAANPSDSLALVAFYNAMNGPGWINKTNWLVGKVGTWFGVNLDVNGRVISLALPNNQVRGTIPASFTTLASLTTLNLQNASPTFLPATLNQLTNLVTLNISGTTQSALPSLAGLSNLTSLILTNNTLTFEDLEPIVSIPGIVYSPQFAFGIGATSNITVGNSWVVQASAGGSANQYQWVKGGVPISGATSTVFTIPAVVTGDAGNYQLRVTSPLVPGLTLTSNPFVLVVPAPGAQNFFTWPQADGIINDTPPRDSYGGYWADIDNDGDDDLAINNLESGVSGRSVDLYENINGHFTRLTGANMPTDEGARNITWADYDNDGYLDFYIGDVGFNALTDQKGAFYHNNGNKTFTRIPLDQVADGGAWADYDNDGLVDLFTMDAGLTNVVYRNLGSGNFALAPVSFASGSEWTLAFADIDNDRDLDLVQVGRTATITNNNLYRNDGNGTFTFLSSSVISTDNLVSARGGSWADIDNDGDMDFFAMNAQTAGTVESAFYINDGTGNFTKQNASILLGADVRGRSSVFGDVDNDGDVDLVVHNGRAGNLGVNVYLNSGTGTFTQLSTAQQSFIPIPNATVAQASLGDANSDGFLDIFSATFSVLQPPAVYRNVGNSNKWIKFRLQGTPSNRAGIGARISIHTGGLMQIREVTSQSGLAAQTSLVQHFGIGTATDIDSVTIFWPSGTIQKLTNIAANQLLTVTEGMALPTYTVIPSDSLALVSFYNSMNGVNWPNKTNWLTGKVNTWYGITVDANYRVRGIALPGNSVSGVMPASFTSLTGLTSLNLSASNLLAPGLPANFSALNGLTTLNLNQTNLSSLSSIDSLTNLTSLIVTNNLLTFEDLEPLMAVPGIQYIPQLPMGPAATPSNIALGNSWAASINVGGSANQYQWYKAGVPVGGATSNTLTIPAVTPTDAGSYQLRATSPLVPGLTLNSQNYALTVVSPGPQNLFTWPQADGIINDTPSDSYGGYWADIDNDGDDDLAISNLQSGLTGRSVDLYENNNGVFTRLTSAGMPTQDGPRNITWADYDNDGDQDFYVGDIAFNLQTDFKGAFYRNNGDKTFTKVVLDQLADGGTWADYDKDGLVDLFIVDAGQPTVVYRNLGGGNFALAPVSFPMGADWMLSFADIDNDRDMDFVQVGKTPNSGFNNLFRNDSVGHYSYQSASIISTENLTFARGGSWADIDNDGDMDFFAMNASTGGVPSTFYINDGAGNFTSSSSTIVLGADVRGRASTFGDVDNDGDIDLVVHNSRAGNTGVNVYLNNGNGTFAQVTAATQSFIPIANPAVAHVSLGDANGDGALDLFSATFNSLQPPALYRNVGNSNKWIKFKLQGTLSNRSGIGARISIHTAGLTQIREVTAETGLASQNSLVQHFGLAAAALVDSVTIFWPSGTIQKINGIESNQVLTVVEGVAPPTYSVITSDSLALVAFYNAMNGVNWPNKTNWLTGRVNTWYGITVSPIQRVEGIALPGNSVIGTIPASFSTLTGLKHINLSASNLSAPGLPANFGSLKELITVNLNQTSLSSFPPIDSLTHLTSLIVTNNLLTFEDLEPLVDVAGINYVPQQQIGIGATGNIYSGNPWTVQFQVGGSANQYQWSKSGIPLGGATNSSYHIPAVTAGDAGPYQLQITSALVPGLTLTTANQVLAIAVPVAQNYFTWPQADGIINDTPSDSYGGYWADIDNDGDDDLAISNLQNGLTGRSVDLYENNNGVFTRLLSAGMPTQDGPRNITWADYDNDGDLDFYVGDIAFNLQTDFKGAFYRNEGNKTFTKVALDQLADGGVWSDYDKDGLVDLFIVDAGQPTVVYRNLGSGNFSLAPVNFTLGSDWTLAFADMDGDHDMDFVQIGKAPGTGFNNLMRNDSVGHYTYQSSSPISTDDLTFARGGSWADIDNDGDMDFFGMNTNPVLGSESIFYINDGTGNFTKQNASLVLGTDVRSRSAAFGDLDNDGDVDLVVHNGRAGNLGVNAFLNNGAGTFTRIPPSAQSFIAISNPSLPHTSLGDANNDGFLDIFSAAFNVLQPPAVYRNVGNANHWIKFRLVGIQSNRSAIGARIRIHTGGLMQIREVTSQTGLAAQNSLVQHFGMGAASQVDSVTIFWPSGLTQRFNNVEANKTLTIVEGINPPTYTVIPSDSLALVSFYNSMNGVNWPNKTNWLTGKVNTWYGITVDANYRVRGIALPGNSVSGVMPASFTSLTGLTSLNLSASNLLAPGLPANFSALNGLTTLNLNQTNLSSLSSIDSLTNLSSLIVTNNFLTFEDLEPLMSVPGIQYIPQLPMGPASVPSNIAQGNSWTASINVGGSANEYQWFKAGVPVGGANSNTLTIPAVAASDAGSYQLRATSPLVPGLTLNSQNYALTVVSPGPQNLFTWPQADGIINDTPSDSYGGYWADIDNDGDDDLAISNLQSGLTGRSVDLYENNNGVFTRLTSAGMPTQDGPRNITWADYDNDGDQDFYVGDIAFNLQTDFKGALYRNEGNKTFTKVALDQLADGGTWADYDKDGLVDLFIVDAGQPTVVYRNLGGGNFALAPVSFPMGADWMLSFADIDNDRDMDFVQVGKTPNSGFNNLFRNDSVGHYSYQSASIISTENLTFARGGSWADIDNDGDMDFFAMNASTGGVPSTFYINDGAGNFTSSSSTIVLGADVRGRASTFGDVDNDGDIDLVVHNIRAGNTGVNVYLNNGNGTFAQVTAATQSFIPIANAAVAHVSLGDANGDGALDLFSATFNSLQPPALYRNVGNSNKWIKFKLQGTLSNRSGIGARISIHTAGLTQIREVTAETGLASQNSLVQHFGLAAAALVDSVTIFWPSGITQRLNDIAANQVMTIVEGETVSAPSVNSHAFVFTTVTVDSLKVSFTPGNGTGRIAIVRPMTPVSFEPQDTVTYVLGQDLGNDQQVVYTGSGNQISLGGLQPDTPYHLRVFEFNGVSGSQLYLRPGADTTQRTLPLVLAPTLPATSITFTNVYSTQMRVDFHPGNGSKRIVVMRPGSAVNFVPVNGAIYAVNHNFSMAGDLGGGNRAVMADTTTFVNVTGLNPSTTYFVSVFEYNGQGSGTKYLTTGAPSASRTTLALPNVYVTAPADNAQNQNVQLNVTSRALSGATTYTIELDTLSDFETPIQKSGSRTQLFTGLKYGRQYYSRVKTDLSPDYGPLRSFTTGMPEYFSYVTSPANNASGVVLNNRRLNITANLVHGASSYTIELSTSPNFDSVMQVHTGGRTQLFTSLNPGTTYYTRVITDIGTAWGQTRQFTTLGASQLTYVVTPANNATNVSYQPSITVSDVGATSYTVQLSPSIDFSSGDIDNTSTTRTVSFTGLQYNTLYYARARTELDAAWGPIRSFTTNSPLTYSYMTSPGNGAVNVNYSLNISSQTVPGATTYTIEANTQSDFMGTSIVRSGGRTLNFALQPNQTYYVRVSTDLLPGQWGAVRSFSTRSSLGYAYITSPADNATNVSYVTNITSNNVPLATYYIIEANTLSDFSGTSIVKMGTGRTYSFTLAHHQTYYVRVQTNIESGQWGPSRSFTTGNPQSLAFVTSPVNGVVAVPTTVNVTSNLVSGATSYIIELNPDSTFAGASIVRSGAGRTKSFTGLSEATTYYSRVSTSLSPGLWGPVRSFTTINPFGRQAGVAWTESLDEDPITADESANVTVFPNPFREQFEVHVQTADQQPLQAQLLDVSGRAVFTSHDWSTNRKHVIHGEFSPGVYLLDLRTKGVHKVVRVVRN